VRVLVVGAAGMIGRKLTERLARDGAIGCEAVSQVTLVDTVEAPALDAPFEVEAVAADIASDGVAGELIAAQVDPLDQVDEADEGADLVGLQLADEVHVDPEGAVGARLGQLGDDLLGVVLPDGPDAGAARRVDGSDRERLGDGQHGDVVVAAGGGDPPADPGEALGDERVELGVAQRCVAQRPVT